MRRQNEDEPCGCPFKSYMMALDKKRTTRPILNKLELTSKLLATWSIVLRMLLGTCTELDELEELSVWLSSEPLEQ